MDKERERQIDRERGGERQTTGRTRLRWLLSCNEINFLSRFTHIQTVRQTYLYTCHMCQLTWQVDIVRVCVCEWPCVCGRVSTAVLDFDELP